MESSFSNFAKLFEQKPKRFSLSAQKFEKFCFFRKFDP